jgi:hypothetical protein
MIVFLVKAANTKAATTKDTKAATTKDTKGTKAATTKGTKGTKSELGFEGTLIKLNDPDY